MTLCTRIYRAAVLALDYLAQGAFNPRGRVWRCPERVLGRLVEVFHHLMLTLKNNNHIVELQSCVSQLKDFSSWLHRVRAGAFAQVVGEAGDVGFSVMIQLTMASVLQEIELKRSPLQRLRHLALA